MSLSKYRPSVHKNSPTQLLHLHEAHSCMIHISISLNRAELSSPSISIIQTKTNRQKWNDPNVSNQNFFADLLFCLWTECFVFLFLVFNECQLDTVLIIDGPRAFCLYSIECSECSSFGSWIGPLPTHSLCLASIELYCMNGHRGNGLFYNKSYSGGVFERWSCGSALHNGHGLFFLFSK